MSSGVAKDEKKKFEERRKSSLSAVMPSTPFYGGMDWFEYKHFLENNKKTL